MGVPKTSDHIQINIRMPNPSQEPPAYSKAQNEDLKDMDVLCTFKIQIKSQKMGVPNTKPICTSRTRCPTPIRNLQRPPEPKMRT